MSYFRHASDCSHSEDTSFEESLAPDSSSTPAGQGRGQLVAPFNSSIVTEHHQNVLLHSLLEEKCLHDTADQLNSQRPRNVRRLTKDDAEVIVHAKERYRVLAEQMIGGGLLSQGLHGEEYRHLRQTARDGIDALSRNFTTLQISQDLPVIAEARRRMDPPTRRLLQDTSGAAALARFPPTTTNPTGVTSDVVPQLLPSHPLLDSARYTRDFEELGFVDKGGFGSVYRVTHRLDGRSYAIKKIVLSSVVVQRVRRKGQSELDLILRELRLMARLEHPNLVRYFSGWVEWARPGFDHRPGHTEASASSYEDGESADPTDSRIHTLASTHSFGMPEGRSPSATAGAEIVFEVGEFDISQSRGNGDVSSASDRATPYLGDLQAGSTTSVEQPDGLDRMKTRGTTTTLTEDDVEEISRSPPPMSRGRPPTTHTLAAVNSPSLVLHIQMSLYPMTLTQYLQGVTDIRLADDDEPITLRHCYHLHTAVMLLLAVLDGVQYLHRHHIIHCDLKPANIFLNPTICQTQSAAPSGSVHVGACAPCRADWSRPLNQQHIHLNVCVGDFGLASPSLATHHAPEAGRHARHAAVGTELYRPPAGQQDRLLRAYGNPTCATADSTDTRSSDDDGGDDTTTPRTAHPSQDMYALGIIFVEMLCSFTTRMERADVLRGVRERGHVPVPSAAGQDTVGRSGETDAVAEVVRWMLDWRRNGGDTSELRRRLFGLLNVAGEES